MTLEALTSSEKDSPSVKHEYILYGGSMVHSLYTRLGS